MLSTLATFLAISVAPLVAAHGNIIQAQAGGTTLPGPNIYYDGDAKNSQTATRKMFKASGPAFALRTDYTNPSVMSCESAGPAPQKLTVAAGSSVMISWVGATGEIKGQGGVTAYNPWVHAMGPVMNYITSCTNGDCTKFDPTNAGWTKLSHMGIDFSQTISGSLKTAMTNKPEPYHPSSGSGLWAMAKLVQDGSKWTINIPSVLAPGEYILRHEIAAVHNPLGSAASSGPQHYISCTNLKVTGSGSTKLPAGTKSSALYDPNGAFAKFDVNSADPHTFQIPGPAVWDQASSGGSTTPSTPSSNTGSSNDSSPKPAATTPKPAASSPKPAASPATTPETTTPKQVANAPTCNRRKRSAEPMQVAQAPKSKRVHRARRH